MRKYVFIKDESYSSTLYNNYNEYISKDDDLKCYFGGAQPYKIKLMTTEKAEKLLYNHPMLLTPNIDKFEPLPSCPLSLVSFGGTVATVNIGRMIRLCDSYGSCSIISPMTSNSEAQCLADIRYTTKPGFKMLSGGHYMYLTMIKLKDTNVYYLITNPTLVQCVGHIEIESDPWIEQIKGIKDTIKDNIFSMSIDKPVINGHIITDGLFKIDMLKESVIQPEDKEEFLQQLKWDIEFPDSAPHSEGFRPKRDTYLRMSIKNELLGNYINEKEKLSWEWVITGM